VLVLEWFLRAARACFPSLVVQGARDLKVFRGVPVEDFDGRGVRLIVHARVLEVAGAETTVVEMKLLDDQDKPRYAAKVILGSVPAQAPASSADEAPGSGEGVSWTVAGAYAEALFHRPPFDVIRSLDPVYDERASAELVGVQAAGWPREPWISDPALLDGGLQLACVWSRHVLGGATLPTAIEAAKAWPTRPSAASSGASARASAASSSISPSSAPGAMPSRAFAASRCTSP
jgi:hypothetical protein